MRAVRVRGRRVSIRVFAVASACAALLVPLSHSRGATQATWLNPTDGNWTEPTNWSTNPNVPDNGTPTGMTYDAHIDATGSPYMITLKNSITLESLTVDSTYANLLQTAGTLTLVNGMTISAGTVNLRDFTNTSAIQTTGSAHLSINGLQNQSTINAGGAVFTLGGTWHNAGAISLSAAKTFIGGTFSTTDFGNLQRTAGVITLLGSFDNTGHTTDLNATFGGGDVVLSGTVKGGTITSTAATAVSFATNAMLDHVTLDTDAALSEGAQLEIQNDLTLPMGRHLSFMGDQDLVSTTPQSIGGAGEIDFLVGGGTIRGSLTIGSDITVKTVGSGGGTIDGSITNNGTVWQAAPGGYLSLDGSFINNGIIRLDAGQLNLGGTDALGNWGVIQHNGGTINFIGTLNNQGKTIDFFATPVGSINLGTGAYINGGTIANSGPLPLQVVNSVPQAHPTTLDLNGVTLASSVDLRGVSPVFVDGTLTLESSAEVRIFGNGQGTTGMWFEFGPNVLTGNGIVSFLGTRTDNSSIKSLSNSNSLTVGPGITIRTVSGGATISGFPLINQGTLSAQAQGKYLYVEGGVTNSGTIDARNGGLVGFSPYGIQNLANDTLTGGTWAAYANSTLDFAGRTFTTNAAHILLDGVGSTFAAVAPLASNTGTFEIDHGRNFTTAGSLYNSGTLRVGQGSTLTIDGTLTNSGKINGKGRIVGNITSSGTIAPGDSPGLLTITGNLTESPDATIEIEVGGTTPGVDYDVLDVSGLATLSGTLEITLVNGFVPTPDQTFDFFDLASKTGQFSSVILPDLPAAVTWDTDSLQAGGPTGVPEPGSLTFLALLTCGSLATRKRATLPRRQRV